MGNIKYFDRMYFFEEEITEQNYELMERKIQQFINMCDGNRFSPIEQIMILYDRVKLFEWKDNEDPEVVRRLSDVIINEAGVCAGYVNVFNECLCRMGFKCAPIGISKLTINGKHDEVGHEEEEHTCEIIEINDDKYNIHGIYIFDPTLDSTISSKCDRREHYTFFAKTIYELYDLKGEFQFDPATAFLFEDNNIDPNSSSEISPSMFFKILKGFYPNDIPNDIVKENWDILKWRANWKEVNQELILNKIAPIAKIIEQTATIPFKTLLKIIAYINPNFSKKDMIDILTYTELRRKNYFKDSFEEYEKKKKSNTYKNNSNNNSFLDLG